MFEGLNCPMFFKSSRELKVDEKKSEDGNEELSSVLSLIDAINQDKLEDAFEILNSIGESIAVSEDIREKIKKSIKKMDSHQRQKLWLYICISGVINEDLMENPEPIPYIKQKKQTLANIQAALSLFDLNDNYFFEGQEKLLSDTELYLYFYKYYKSLQAAYIKYETQDKPISYWIGRAIALVTTMGCGLSVFFASNAFLVTAGAGVVIAAIALAFFIIALSYSIGKITDQRRTATFLRISGFFYF